MKKGGRQGIIVVVETTLREETPWRPLLRRTCFPGT
jgi:hypothetical protein